MKLRLRERFAVLDANLRMKSSLRTLRRSHFQHKLARWYRTFKRVLALLMTGSVALFLLSVWGLAHSGSLTIALQQRAMWESLFALFILVPCIESMLGGQWLIFTRKRYPYRFYKHMLAAGISGGLVFYAGQVALGLIQHHTVDGTAIFFAVLTVVPTLEALITTSESDAP